MIATAITMRTHTLSCDRLTSGWWWRSCSREVREMSSLHSLSQSSEIDYGAPESIHNDPPGPSGLRLPQEGQDNVTKPILWIRVPIHNCLDIAWLDVQHQTQQVSAVLRIQQFFKYPRRITFRQRIVNGRGCVRIVSTLDTPCVTRIYLQPYLKKGDTSREW